MYSFRTGTTPSYPSACRPCHSLRGFTLIELMVVLVIAGVLAAVALPAYQRQVAKGRRADALTALSSVLQAQERRRSNTNAYTTSIANLNVTAPTHYEITVTGISDPIGDPPSLAVGFIARATPIATGLQAADTDCADMSIQVQRGNVSYMATNSAGVDTKTKCWPQ